MYFQCKLFHGFLLPQAKWIKCAGIIQVIRSTRPTAGHETRSTRWHSFLSGYIWMNITYVYTMMCTYLNKDVGCFLTNEVERQHAEL